MVLDRVLVTGLVVEGGEEVAAENVVDGRGMIAAVAM